MMESNGNGKEIPLYTPIFDILVEKYHNLETAAIYGQYWRWCEWSKNNVCIQSYDDIGAAVGISGRTVERRFRILVADGYLLDLTPERRNDPHEVMITEKMMLEARSNGHTNMTKKGKRRDKSIIGMTGSRTNYDNDSLSEQGMTGSPNGMTPSQSGTTPSQSRYDRESVEDTKETIETKKEEERNTSSSSFVSYKKDHPAVLLWIEIVKPTRLTEEDTQQVIDTLGDNPSSDILMEALATWREKVNENKRKTGKEWSITLPAPILKNYEEIANRPKPPLTYKVDYRRVVVIWSDGEEIPISEDGVLLDRETGTEIQRFLPVGKRMWFDDELQLDDDFTWVRFPSSVGNWMVRTAEGYFVSKPQEGETRKTDNPDYPEKVFRGGKWVEMPIEGLVAIISTSLPRVTGTLLRGGKVNISDFHTNHNGWIPSTREEVQAYIDMRNRLTRSGKQIYIEDEPTRSETAPILPPEAEEEPF